MTENLGGAVLSRYVTSKERKDQLRKKFELKTSEAAEYCDMSVRTLYNLIHAGDGPGREQDGRRGRMTFTISELDAWKRQRNQKKRAFTR